LTQVGRLDFEEVQERKYPCLFLALHALKRGGGAPAALNGANEEVVAAYLSGAFPFLRIAGILKQVMARIETATTGASAGSAPAANPRGVGSHSAGSNAEDGAGPLSEVRTVSDALSADRWGREQARALIAASALS